MGANKIGETVLGKLKGKAVKTVLNPLNEILDDQISDISTTLGLFVVRSIRGKLQRSITFTIGTRYSDRWMEEAIYGILYEYNNIRASSKLELANKTGVNDGSVNGSASECRYSGLHHHHVRPESGLRQELRAGYAGTSKQPAQDPLGQPDDFHLPGSP